MIGSAWMFLQKLLSPQAKIMSLKTGDVNNSKPNIPTLRKHHQETDVSLTIITLTDILVISIGQLPLSCPQLTLFCRESCQ